MDSDSNIIAGLCYKILENDIVLLDGTVVTAPLHGRGVGSGMIEDFFIRMRSQRVKIIKAHFLFGNYYLKHNFKVDKKWGALVKVL
jgi:predicted GNAT family acetyltransferase